MPGNQAISDDEFKNRCKFITGTIMGSGWECKEYNRDFLPFQAAYKPSWGKLYQRWVENEMKEWPCFDKPDVLEFVKDGHIVTERIPIPNDWVQQE